MILPIYTYDQPVLRKETTPVADDSAALQKLIDNMFESMHNANGIGLAANQVGKNMMMTVIDISDAKGYELTPPYVLINPVLIGTHGESVFEEGCLSLPEIREEVVRPSEIGVKFLDRNFNEIEMEADKLLARVIQHEIDHLHGIYFIDHLSAFKRSLLKGKLSKMKKGEVEADYPLQAPPVPKKKRR
ncbi:MAG TPA: peptide deformylase [Candidatus Kapabacteria bacterium]|nr:peptide deformylase [Candidatus Kapabacteria bacterium]